jgi:flagellar motility protein MotE (MotC chaperone)
MRLRLLPVLVLTASLALTVRLGDLWRGVDGMARAQTAGEAPNTPAAAPTAATPGEQPAAAPPPVVKAAQPAAPAASGGTASGGTAMAPQVQQARTVDLPSDPLLMTDEEIDLLRALGDRRRVLDERARELADREALLQAAQRRIEEKVDGLEELKKSIEALLEQQEGQAESQYLSLVKIYENMKPKDAARIFEEMEMAVLIPVVKRMKERKTAPILAKMDPVKAQAITAVLAETPNPPAKEQKTEQK